MEGYLPRPGLKLLFHEVFPDGEEADMEVVTAKLAEAAAISVLQDILVEGESVAKFVQHYVVRNDHVAVVPDDNPEDGYPYLTRNLTKGAKWEKDGIVHTVMDTGVRVDLGFMVAENCVVIDSNNTVVEYREIVYYAPGLGAVFAKDPGGNVILQLKSVTTIGEKQAADLVRPLAPNIGQVKP